MSAVAKILSGAKFATTSAATTAPTPAAPEPDIESAPASNNREKCNNYVEKAFEIACRKLGKEMANTLPSIVYTQVLNILSKLGNVPSATKKNMITGLFAELSDADKYDVITMLSVDDNMKLRLKDVWGDIKPSATSPPPSSAPVPLTTAAPVSKTPSPASSATTSGIKTTELIKNGGGRRHTNKHRTQTRLRHPARKIVRFRRQSRKIIMR
jgi:hypothetical protein